MILVLFSTPKYSWHTKSFRMATDFNASPVAWTNIKIWKRFVGINKFNTKHS